MNKQRNWKFWKHVMKLEFIAMQNLDVKHIEFNKISKLSIKNEKETMKHCCAKTQCFSTKTVHFIKTVHFTVCRMNDIRQNIIDF